MRGLIECVAVAAIVSVVAGCEGSTAPLSCDHSMASAAFVNRGQSIDDGVITSINLMSGSAVGGPNSRTEVTVRSLSNPSFEEFLIIGHETAIFTQHAADAPMAASACALALGDRVIQYGTGFGDGTLSQDGSMPDVPPRSQVVIVR